MSRWIRPQQLIKAGITIQEQIEWAELGLNVYDIEGRRIIEHDRESLLPPGCKYLTSTDYFRAGDTFQYCHWNDTHDFFTKFQFSRNKLVLFLQAPKPLSPLYIANEITILMHNDLSENDIRDRIENKKKNSAPLLNSIYTPELGYLLGIQSPFVFDTSNPTKQVQVNTNNKSSTASTSSKGQQDTSKATEATAIKTAQAWAQDLEVAVALAVECAEQQKARSTQQHRIMWEKRCSEKGIHTPRKEALAAFRRGLPAHLKMEKN